MRVFIAALALGAALPGQALAHRAPPAIAMDAQADAEQLIGILLSQESIAELGGRAFDYGVSQGEVADPKLRKLYDANPGMKEYVASKVRPEFQVILTGALPQLRHDLSAIVLDEMTPDEIADTLTFFASPTGVKMKAQIYRSIGDKPDQTQAEMQQSAVASAMATLTPDDYPALLAFGQSSAAQKMQAVTPKISAAGQQWAEQMIAANGDRLQQVAVKAQAEFLAKKK
ncbi:MAG: hypothetical protein ABW023_03860 [Sphingomonas sp.]